ncbi:von Willebrand factor A domain-containing protein 7 [Osmerus mordax]|uniref:von Willebrand factor A domain-containing protein 7 n=1 Tax=Osmerus mordax TaxID=8014 RepID=UPI00350FB3AC
MSQNCGESGLKLIRVHILVYLLALPFCESFLPNFWSRVLTLSWKSNTHQEMTEQAILNITLETLSSINTHKHAHTQNQMKSDLGRGFWRAVGEVVKSNAAMDFLSSTRSNPVYHFDSERIEDAIQMLQLLQSQTVLSVQAKDYQGARHSLGQLFHSLQDFYSHSNWVEMGQRSVYLHLLNPDEPALPVATEDTPTCMECFSATCRDNLLQAQQHPLMLTTGYFSSDPPKPQGKCSHGGILDSSRHQGAKGGINKDSTSPLFSPHHYLHAQAARLATTATINVLRDLRDNAGPSSFLRLFSVKQPPALVFVMDTTGSMFEEISAARRRALSIIQARADSLEQRGTFLLVPFHDPDVGPVLETEDPDQFMLYMEDLMALGGGDEPEMCLTAIQLALTHSPALSEIFVFTDASPKDAHLYSAVKALTLEKQCKVTFLLTEDPSLEMVSRGRRETLSPNRFSLYTSLSSVSGGLTIFTSNSDIYRVSTIVEDKTSADKVTLVHAESDSASVSIHSFRVDSAVKSVTLHITGDLTEYTLTSPTGRSQSLLQQQSPLAELQQSRGLYRISLLSPVEPGQWQMTYRAEGHTTFTAIGDSSVDFLYYFAVEANETHPGLARVEGNPVAGVPMFLVLVVTGILPNEEVFFSHVTLLGANGESLQSISLNSSSAFAEELVGRMDSVPREPFCVRLSGRDGNGNELQRISTEMIQPTHVQIQVLSAPRLVPGHTTSVDFNVLNHGPARLFSLTADDDHGYLSQRGPQLFPVGEMGSIRDKVNIHIPGEAEAGAAVTLTLTVEALDSADSNYAVLHMIVVPLDLDTSPPSCSPTPVKQTCPSQCTGSSWSVSLAVTDKGRSGLSSLQLSLGQGTLTLLHGPAALGDGSEEDQPSLSKDQETGEQGGQKQGRPKLEQGDPAMNVSEWVGRSGHLPLWVTYSSSCCSPQAELLVWDWAGNMRRCHLTSSLQRGFDERSKETNGSGNTTTGNVLLLLSTLFTIIL